MTLILLIGFLTHAPYCDVLHYDCQDYSNDSNPVYLGPYFSPFDTEEIEDNEQDKDEIDLDEYEYFAKIDSNEKDKRKTACYYRNFQSRSV